MIKELSAVPGTCETLKNNNIANTLTVGAFPLIPMELELGQEWLGKICPASLASPSPQPRKERPGTQRSVGGRLRIRRGKGRAGAQPSRSRQKLTAHIPPGKGQRPPDLRAPRQALPSAGRGETSTS